jgi:hypothetical protein
MGRNSIKVHKNHFAILSISLISVIFLFSSYSDNLPEASAVETRTVIQNLTFYNVSSTFDNWTTQTGSTNDAEKLLAILENDAETSYITSTINNDIQGFISNVTINRAESINYIAVVSIADKTEDARKATKFSQGLAMNGVAIALPNGGSELNLSFTETNQTFYTNPFSAKNDRNQLAWTLDDIPNLEYVVEQNTDTKEVRITQFYAQISYEILPPTINITSYPSSVPWGHTATVSGNTTGIAEGDTITIEWGDGSETEIPASAEWSISHEYSKNSISSTETKIVKATLTAGTITDDDSVTIDVLSHDTSLDAPIVPSNVKWGFAFNVTGNILSDLNATGCVHPDCQDPILGKPITYSGTAIQSSDSGISTVSVANPVRIVAVGLGNTGNQTIFADFDGTNDPAYNNSTSPVSTTIIDPHTTSLNTPTLSDSEIKWGEVFKVSNTLTDLDSSGCAPETLICPQTIEGGTITYDGEAVASSTSYNSTVTNSNIISNQITGLKTITGTFDGNSDYTGSSNSNSINLLKHTARIFDLNTAGESQTTGQPLSVTGTLIDVDNDYTGIKNKIIKFSGNGTGPSGIPNAITGGVKLVDSNVTDSLDELIVEACPDCSTGENVVRVTEGTKLQFEVPIPYVILYYENTTDGTIKAQVTGLDEKTFISDDEAGINSMTLGPNVSEITINSVPGPLGLVQVVGQNEQGNIFVLHANLTTIPIQNATELAIGGGSFSNGTENAPEVNGDNYIIVAKFNEDESDSLYTSATNSTFYNLEENQIGDLGIGGTLVNVVADAGIGISGADCGTKDIDGDALCDGWEEYGKGFRIDGTKYRLNLPDLDKTQKNIYVEIDYMKDHKPDPIALQQVTAAFAAKNIKTTFFVDEEIDHVTNLGIWKDNDSNSTNDFDSIKANYYGNSTERSYGSGQITTSTTGSASSHTLTIDGIQVTTPTQSSRISGSTGDKTQGTIVIKAVVTTNNPIILTSTGVTIPTPSSADLTVSSPSVSILGLPKTEHTVTIEVPFLTTGAISNVGLGQIDVTLEEQSGSSFNIPTIAETKPNSPAVVSTLEESYAQVVRYMIFGHSMGGSSGTAEFLGNDAAIMLGEGFGGSVLNHAGSVGTTEEQAGTVMHEMGHWLGLKHGGPEKIGGVSVGDADVNCKSNYVSVMSYSRQTSAYLGSNWVLDYSSGNMSPLIESQLNETEGFRSTSLETYNHPFMRNDGRTFAPASTSIPNNDPFINVNFDKTDGIKPNPSLVSVDINNFGISGCNTAKISTTAYNDYDDWSNLKFDFRDTVSGQFDGATPIYPTVSSDLNFENAQLARLQAFNFTGLIPPPSEDGLETRNPGSTLPLKAPIVDGQGIPIDFATVSATYITNATGPKSGDVQDASGETIFEYNEAGGFYNLNWKTPKKEGTYWITIFVQNPNPSSDGGVGPDWYEVINEGQDPPLQHCDDVNDPSTCGPVTAIITLKK